MKKIFPDIEIIRPSKYVDNRGEIWTTYDHNMFKQKVNINHTKYSTSKKGVVRGFHGDYKTHKIVTCIFGKIFFVIVDNRKNSKTYMQYEQMFLDHIKREVVLIPPGYANGFCVLSDHAIFSYVLSYEGQYVDAEDQFTLKWNDPNIGVKWPINNPILSQRDK